MTITNILAIDISNQTKPSLPKRWTSPKFTSAHTLVQTSPRTTTALKIMWSWLFNAKHLTHLCIQFRYWDTQLEGIIRYAIGHGVTCILQQEGEAFSAKVPNVFSRTINKPQRPKNIRVTCPECTTTFLTLNSNTTPACPTCHFIVNRPDAEGPVWEALNEVRKAWQEYSYQPRFTTPQVDYYTKQNVQAMQTCIDSLQLLKRYDLKSTIKEIAQTCEGTEGNLDDDGHRIYSFFQTSPFQNKQAFLDFSVSFSKLYDLPHPSTDEDALINGMQILYYLSENITPCWDVRHEQALDKEVLSALINVHNTLDYNN